MGIGTTELLIIFAILIVLFGAKRLPELVNGLGQSIANFRRSTSGHDLES